MQKEIKTWKIKGSCENCGYEHTGLIHGTSEAPDVFPDILCPKCRKETQNFDEEKVVDRLDKEEGITSDYNPVEEYQLA